MMERRFSPFKKLAAKAVSLSDDAAQRAGRNVVKGVKAEIKDTLVAPFKKRPKVTSVLKYGHAPLAAGGAYALGRKKRKTKRSCGGDDEMSIDSEFEIRRVSPATLLKAGKIGVKVAKTLASGAAAMGAARGGQKAAMKLANKGARYAAKGVRFAKRVANKEARAAMREHVAARVSQAKLAGARLRKRLRDDPKGTLKSAGRSAKDVIKKHGVPALSGAATVGGLYLAGKSSERDKAVLKKYGVQYDVEQRKARARAKALKKKVHRNYEGVNLMEIQRGPWGKTASLAKKGLKKVGVDDLVLGKAKKAGRVALHKAKNFGKKARYRALTSGAAFGEKVANKVTGASGDTVAQVAKSRTVKKAYLAGHKRFKTARRVMTGANVGIGAGAGAYTGKRRGETKKGALIGAASGALGAPLTGTGVYALATRKKRKQHLGRSWSDIPENAQVIRFCSDGVEFS